MKNVKTFDTNAEYSAYITSSSADFPNISYVKENDKAYITNIPKVTAKFNITSIGETTILSSTTSVSAIVVDGVKQESVTTAYTFTTVGEHEIKYILTGNTIGASTFASASTMISANISNSVTSIGASAFTSCSSLSSVTIPNSVTSIGASAFRICTSLGSIIIPDSITSISSSTFRDCSSLTSITIPNTVTIINASAFTSCIGLTSVTIPNSVTSIGGYAFSSCTSLASVTIGEGMTTIGNYAFRSCSSLQSIVSYATTAPTIGSSTFRAVKTGGVLSYRAGSTGYDVWMQNTNYYLGLRSWTSETFVTPADSD